MHAKYEGSTSNCSKVIANVKVDNRQTNKQTNKQDKNNTPPIIRSGDIKSGLYHRHIQYICAHEKDVYIITFIYKRYVRMKKWFLSPLSRFRAMEFWLRFCPCLLTLHVRYTSLSLWFCIGYCTRLWIRPTPLWKWFAQSWIRPLSIFLHNPLHMIKLAQF